MGTRFKKFFSSENHSFCFQFHDCVESVLDTSILTSLCLSLDKSRYSENGKFKRNISNCTPKTTEKVA